MRVGSVVTVSGKVDLEGEPGGPKTFKISLPVATTSADTAGGAISNSADIPSGGGLGVIGGSGASVGSEVIATIPFAGAILRTGYWFTFTYLIA